MFPYLMSGLLAAVIYLSTLYSLDQFKPWKSLRRYELTLLWAVLMTALYSLTS